jgi:hypothetical protein
MATPEQHINNDEQGSGRFQSDAQKLANQHLADQNHVITDEDLQNVRVGMTPPPDEPTQQAIKDAEERIADRKTDSEDDTIPGAQKTTPWDVID